MGLNKFHFFPHTPLLFLPRDQIKLWQHEQTLALALLDPALTQNVYLSGTCHQVYEQQIANLKNMSLAVQINPINPNSHLLIAHSTGSASCGIYFLACLFSDSVNVNMGTRIEVFLVSLDQEKHILRVRTVWPKQTASFWNFSQWHLDIKVSV